MRLLPRIVEDADRAYVYDNSSNTVGVFPFHAGRDEPTTDEIPDFLRAQLVIPLKEREADRDLCSSYFSDATDEESGTYEGHVTNTPVDPQGTDERIKQLHHYFLQRTQTGVIRHDSLLFDAPPAGGQMVKIRYKECVGSCELL
jgi:hypothetical protein